MENTMLIVDDVEMNREILGLLFDKNYAVLEAEDGEEALAVIERCQGSIDIVLLDLMMPGLSGFDVLEKRKELDYFKNVPVVVITSSGAMDDQIRAFEYGANDYIVKPFIPEIVISRVNNVMASHQRMRSVQLEAQKLKIKSELDQMTGLYNKTTTELLANDALLGEPGKLNALMVIDIDNFKAVNDNSGHLAGDHVIKIVADMISGMFRKTDIVGRVGGDEFVVMMVDVPSMDIVYSKANELIQTMRYKPNLTIPEYVTLSIGMSCSKTMLHTDYDTLFKEADEALYLAKQDGKARYREYGVEPINLEQDSRPAALLLSSNRSVCSSIHALVPTQLRIIEALSMDDLDNISEKERSKIVVVYADVSDRDDSAADYWEELKKYPWIKPEETFAVCLEGSISQYSEALSNHVADMFTTPIDAAAFKRRTLRKLDALGITHKPQ